MQGLDHLTRGELLERVRILEERVSRLSTAAGLASPTVDPALGLDFVCEQALQVLENSGVAAFVYETTPSFTLLATNQCMATLSGHTRHELTGLGLMSLLAHRDRNGVRRLLTLPRQGGFSSSGGWRLRTRLGEIREIEASGYDLDYRGRHARFVIVQDVTRRKREQLMQQRLASIVENSHDAIVSTTIEGTVLSWNHAAEQLFGFSAADMVGRSMQPVLPADMAADEQTWIKPRILAGEQIDSRETVRLHRNGERIDVSISVAPLRDAAGSIVGVSSIIRDVRAHKEAQRELAQSHDRLRALASLSYDWCWEQDENLRFTYHSREWAEFRPASHAALMGRTRFELPIVWLSEQQKEEHAGVLAGRKPFKDLEYRVRDPSGKKFHLTVSGEPIFDEGGGFKGYRGIGRDITEKKKQEQRLRLLSAIVGSSDDAIMSWSLAGALLSWNPGAESMLGYGADEILSKSMSMLMPSSSNGDWEEVTRRVVEGEKVVNHESVRRHRNGTMIPVAMTCSPMRDEAGRVTAVSCVARDIRRQKVQDHLVSESHQRLKLALESADLSLWDWDIPALRVHYDNAFPRMLDYKPGELPDTARPWEGLLHPEDAPLVAERIESHLVNRRDFFELEFRLRTHRGDWLWIGARGRVIVRDRVGSPLRMMGTCQVIAERKRAEQMSQMLAAFLESSEDCIVSRTLDGTILSWNRGAEHILGYSAAEMVGKNHLQLVPEERLEEIARITELVRGGNTVSNVDTLRRHKSGREVHLSVTVAPLKDASGRVTGMASIGRDITERMHAESARALLAAVVESSQDAIISHTLDGTILSWNRGAEEMFGYRASEAIERDFHLLVTGEAAERLRDRCTRIEKGERISFYETLARRKDGGFVLIALSAAALRNPDGLIVGVAAVARDIGSQKRLELLMARTEAIGHVGGWELDCRSEHLFWTEETYRIHDVSPQQFAPSRANALEFYPPQARSIASNALQRATARGEAFDLELPLITASGRHIWVRAIGEPQTENARITHIYGTLQDITSRRQAEEALRQSERQLESILDNAAEGIVVLSASGMVERLNRQAQHLFGYTSAEAPSLNLKQLTVELGHEHQPGDVPNTWLGRLLYTRREVTGRRKDGSIFPLEIALSEIEMSPGPNKLTAIVRDITERKSWESRIYSLAYSDSLTGLPNRLLLRDRLEHAIAAAQRNRTLVGVLFLDLDYFKAINDSYGHHAGDQVLREIGERTKRCVREIDTVCRLGGDEFVIVLPQLRDGLDAGAVARKILAALAEPYYIEAHAVTITPTLGIALYPQDGPDAETLLRNADTAMYHAKESGKNRFRFFSLAPG